MMMTLILATLMFTLLFAIPKKSLFLIAAMLTVSMLWTSEANACGRGASIGVGSGRLFQRLATLRQRIRPNANAACTSCQGCQSAQLPVPQFPSVVVKVIPQATVVAPQVVAKFEKPKPALPSPTFVAPAVANEPAVVLPATAQSASGSAYTRTRTVTVQSGVQSASSTCPNGNCPPVTVQSGVQSASSTCPNGNCPQSGVNMGWAPGRIFGGLFGRR